MLSSTLVATPLGTFQLSCNDKGLTEIILPGPSTSLPNEAMKNRAESPILESAAQQIIEYCNGKRTIFDLPLDVDGTTFQQQVWDIIRSIPYGKTISYGEIGAHLGSKGKARAVGGAANANRLPLVIPCHRVIGADGSLTGFAGGINLKERLLFLEQEPW